MSAEIVERIGAARVLPVVRAPDRQTARTYAKAVLDAGLGAIELTTTIPGWADLLPEVVANAGDTLIGMGTVTSAADAALAVALGAHFLVSPYPVEDVRTFAREHGILFIEGGMTPAELAVTVPAGIGKLFPAHVGGLAYLKSVSAILPGLKIIPTGGIPVADVPDWLAGGAFAVGVGSDLYAGGDISAKLATLKVDD
ncbi:bifunctional 4-hydroxy-2-oxoglutarate aldolase/2-dehydro-3-deoxy-phosphogluconate aldolase [Fodinicola feengrottensis]|uniref:Bifunctional 4-hydroxy-2-oxoglutarate aldolase/2-dehydro-3-deoxy-phosphogluconate aldolase n=1 Tax=Fodinicola feengrottensis TaxID=435914 RepID=A0ABN2HNZ6_9ACTN|nr:aldolase [Fodinicola feengrottensis]